MRERGEVGREVREGGREVTEGEGGRERGGWCEEKGKQGRKERLRRKDVKERGGRQKGQEEAKDNDYKYLHIFLIS